MPSIKSIKIQKKVLASSPKYHQPIFTNKTDIKEFQKIAAVFGSGDLERIKALNFEPDQRINGWTPLLLTADCDTYPPQKMVEAARYFLDLGADINARGRFNRTALHFACIRNNYPLAKLLLERKAVIEPDSLGDTPLHRAAVNGCPELIELLLTGPDCDLEFQNIELRTPLLRAVVERNKKERNPYLEANIRCLISYKANRSARDIYGLDCDDYQKQSMADHTDKKIKPVPDSRYRIGVVEAGDEKAVTAIFEEQKGDALDPVTPLNDTLLSTASLNGQTSILRILTAQPRADIHHENIEKKRPLYWAVFSNHNETAEYLLELMELMELNGIQLDFKESVFGETVIQRAVINRNAAMVYMLLAQKADLQIPNRFGQTALHLCVSSPLVSLEILNLLLAYNPIIDHKDQQEKTPLMVAAENKHKEAVIILIDAGANAYEKDNRGKTAIDRMPEIEKYLQEREIRKKFLIGLEQEIKKLTGSEQISAIEQVKAAIHRIVENLQLGIRAISLETVIEPYLANLNNAEIRATLENVMKTIANSDTHKKQEILRRLSAYLEQDRPKAIRRIIKRVKKEIRQVEIAPIASRISEYEAPLEFKSSRKEPNPYHILSIDGGGIRGIIPSIVLCEIEKQTRKPISSLFNLIAGTSTGGILAGGLTTPGGALNVPKYGAFDILDLYTRRGIDIFPTKSFLKKFLIHKWDLFSIKYSADNLEQIAHNYFGNRTLSQSLTDLIVTSYDTVTRMPWFFRSREADGAADYYMRDIIRATSAAPTFFPPKIIGDHIFIDGGVATNNPAMEAYASARRAGVEDRDIFMVSLGTGEPKATPISRRTLFLGELFWTGTITGIAMDGANFNVDQNLADIFSDCPNRYNRFQIEMAEPIRLDGVDSENIQKLVDLGKELVEKESDLLGEVVEKLV